ncbi:MAG TPA: hypothetical protein VGE15_05660, partial [Sphingobacteriaceae bacterium]
MIKIFRLVLLSAILFTGVSASAQTTTSSPYSQFGLGDIKGLALPQQRGMGGIGMGLRRPGGYGNINLMNPASYSAVHITTFDAGGQIGIRQLSKNSITETGSNASFSHFAFAIPVVRNHSAISFGIVPFSELGYRYKLPAQIDTHDVNYVYSGDGGLSKAHFGYGLRIGKNLSIGANVGYIFGKLNQVRATEFADPSALNSRIENSNSVGGFTLDYGVQYVANLTGTTKLILGYAGNNGRQINSTSSSLSTAWRIVGIDEDSGPLDTLSLVEGSEVKLDMPLTHSFGFAIEKTNYWLVGADVNLGQWSDFTAGGVNAGLNNTFGVAVGGQVTPDPTSVTNYFKLIDYRLGFKYDKTQVRVRNTDINQYAMTVGLGLPLPANRTAFYKINFSAELGQRGTLSNSLVRE